MFGQLVHSAMIQHFRGSFAFVFSSEIQSQVVCINAAFSLRPDDVLRRFLYAQQNTKQKREAQSENL
jgi:hypothetical protein